MRNSVLIILVMVLTGALVLVVYWPCWYPKANNPNPAFLTSTDPGTASSDPGRDEVPPGTLVFCADPRPPYTGAADTPRPGYVVEILQWIFEREGFKVSYVNLPWSHCIEDAREGRISALAGAHEIEVPDFIFSQQSIGRTQPTFFVGRDTDWEYRDITSLETIRLGVIQDLFYAGEVEAYIQDSLGSERILSVKGQDSQRRLLEALGAGHIDAFLENAPLVPDVLRVMEFDKSRIKAAGALKSDLPLYIAFSPRRVDSEALARIFDLGMERLRARKALSPILDGYGMRDWIVAAPSQNKGN